MPNSIFKEKFEHFKFNSNFMFKNFFKSAKNMGNQMLVAGRKAMESPVAKRVCMVVIMVAFCTADMWAQAAGVTGLETATGTFGSYVTPIKNLLYIIAAIVSMVGAFSIYFKMQNGDQDVKKTIMMTVGGCVALVVMATALPSFFDVEVH